MQFQLLTLLVGFVAGLASPAYKDSSTALPEVAKALIYDEQVRIVLGSGDPNKLRPRTNEMPEQFRAQAKNIFVLESYWVSEDLFQGVEGNNFVDFRNLFVREKNGKKQYRLLIHPLSKNFYLPFLHESEKAEDFLATPTASNRSLVAWLPGKEDRPFVIKVSLAQTIGGVDRTLNSSEVTASVGINNLLQGAKDLLGLAWCFKQKVIGITQKVEP